MKQFLRVTGLVLLVIVVGAGLWGYEADVPLATLKQKYGQQPSQYVVVDSMQVHYRVEGQGPPLLLLHGTAASLHTWDGWTEQLKAHFQVIRVDLPAFGLTGPSPKADYSLKAYSNFVLHFTQALGLEPHHVAGNSLGGAIAWHYALDHPKRVNKLILVDASGYPTGQLPGCGPA